MNRKANLVNNYFIQIYLTIIALLQSVALGNLVPHLISYFTSPKNSFFNVHTPPLLITLLIIFIVWHHYVYGIIYLRWFPNILDALIPFVISITQSFLIAFVESQNTGDNMDQWIRSFAFFLFFGASAYFAAALRHDAELFTNIMDRPSSEAHKRNIRDFYSKGRDINAVTVRVCFNDFAFTPGRPDLGISYFFPFTYCDIRTLSHQEY